MENEFGFNKKDELVMKLLHYFITKEGYAPIVLHGAKDEIWLENMQKEHKVIRIVSGYIRNKEQLEFDIFKTLSIVKSIKKKTFSFKVDVLSIFVNIEDDVEFEDVDRIKMVKLKEEEDLEKYDVIKEFYPNIRKNLKTNENSLELFTRITNEINENSKKTAEKIDDIFIPKKPYVTKVLIGINTIMMLLTILFGVENNELLLIELLGNTNGNEYYRLITSMFMHGDLVHFLFNNYALYIIGSQVESFFGKYKYLLIYIISGISGNLLSSIFLKDYELSIGASGAIFGLLGSLLYFGYYYRVYIGTTLKSQIIPLILINLMIGLSIPGIDNFGHIGGLIGGLLTSMAIGVKYKKDESNELNGKILLAMYFIFLIFIFIK